MIDAEDERWRVMCARLILGVGVALYSSVISLALFLKPRTQAGLVHAGALLLLCAVGAFTLSRMRVVAIATIGIAALLSVSILVAFVMQGHLSTIVWHSGWRWQRIVGYCLALMLYESPVAAFFVVWPLRRRSEIERM